MTQEVGSEVDRISKRIADLLGEELNDEQVDHTAYAFAHIAYAVVTETGDLDEWQRLQLVMELQTSCLHFGRNAIDTIQQRHKLRTDEPEGRA